MCDNEFPRDVPVEHTLAKPLHLQRLEASLNMGPFMSYAQRVLSESLSTSDSGESDLEIEENSKRERQEDKKRLFNFSQVDSDRKWLQNLLLSDSDSNSDYIDEEEYVKEMLRNHVKEQKFREMYYKSTNNAQYGYYGAGLVSNYDMFPEHQRSIVGLKKKRKQREGKSEKQKNPKIKKQYPTKPKGDVTDSDLDIDWDDATYNEKLQQDDEFNRIPFSPSYSSRRSKRKSGIMKTPEAMAARRRKVWQLMAKKELGKFQRAKVNNHKEIIQSCKRVGSMCMKIIRHRAMQSQKSMKETLWRAKRLTREMQGYWKRYDRVERETRRRMEKEAEEQRKLDVEIIEAKRQTRKLNFLITQTELYAHFMSKKLGHGTEEEQLRILNQLDEEVNPRLAGIDDYNSDLMKQKAQKNASDAFNTERARTQEFNVAQSNLISVNVDTDGVPEYPQPNIFKGVLKGYQLKGMTWLANLYDQGISGILADEMGLGKTVQSIAFLCHIAERYGVWGPFLIISPASTLHNWQQEMQRFVPDFNVVPYWGSPNERKILRQFWEQKDMHTKDASFHVVITSYQLVVSDYKYFNRIKWQYMVLDEAQAIKSSSSVRWKLLLGFNCRNRLLLSGTPIQNSMAELWALLHFIMPTLFDSHDEFNEWFSKDIESHAENKTGIDEKQISRLHMILKPFMLRRIKKDVENELSDKIEIMVYCPLTTRQKLLYIALKKKIRIEDLLHYTVGGGDGHGLDKSFTSNLMNLVMQFRKVCNHPELFERRDAKSPFFIKTKDFVLPRLIYNEGLVSGCHSKIYHLLYNRFSIYKAEHVQRSIFRNGTKEQTLNKNYIDLNIDSAFSFSRLTNLCPLEIERIALYGIISFLEHVRKAEEYLSLLNYRRSMWKAECNNTRSLLLEPIAETKLSQLYPLNTNVIKSLIFTNVVSYTPVYTFGKYQTSNMQETIEHRVIRSKNQKWRKQEILSERQFKEEPKDEDSGEEVFVNVHRGRPPNEKPKALNAINTASLLPEFPYYPRSPRKYACEPLEVPKCLLGLGTKIQSTGRKLYCYSRAAQWTQIRHEQCENPGGFRLVMNALKQCKPLSGWSNISIPDKQTLVSDAGKLSVLDGLLTKLKSQGHRVLIYSQMTKMIDLLEEYMWHRKHRYMRLDGSSKISARRDMVADFQSRADIFVFLLSTRAGGLGINLTAADTVIFYDSDWNPTVDQQAMDRAHRLGQTKQVTVYRLICKGTIEERILQRAREKSEIQRMVISGGNFKPDTLKPKEVVSLLLDDAEIELKYRQKTEERKHQEEAYYSDKDGRDKKRKLCIKTEGVKKTKQDGEEELASKSPVQIESSYKSSQVTSIDAMMASTSLFGNDDSSNETLIVDCDSPNGSSTVARSKRRHHPRGTKRGRPRGSRRGGGTGSAGRSDMGLAHHNTLSTDDLFTKMGDGVFTPATPPVKRGPGRPRLKPSGPPHQGHRGVSRTRKPVGPLVVPLGQSPAATPLNRSPAISPAISPAPERGVCFYQQFDDDL